MQTMLYATPEKRLENNRQNEREIRILKGLTVFHRQYFSDILRGR